MILLVPINPEVPQVLRPSLWPSLLLVCLLILGFLTTKDVLKSDSEYISSLENSINSRSVPGKHLDKETEEYLALRPLLSVAPSKGDWDIERLLKANFIHGSETHLLLNAIGIFAGLRICTTFIPVLSGILIFLLGGSLGLWVSVITSKQISDYVPHVGASAGLFALMGTYYVFNFRFRTQYFFWLPIRRGFISLRTSWFFFVDVILLELVLSAAQLFPDHIDSIDHIAHVVGFFSGVILALGYRLVMRWPSFLQTRAEFVYWQLFAKEKTHRRNSKFQTWLELLQINRYNDFLKTYLCKAVIENPDAISDAELNEAFKFFVPTFARLNTGILIKAIKSLLSANRTVPHRWLSRVPYDIIIRIARNMAKQSRDRLLLFRFLSDYKATLNTQKKLNSNLDRLMTSLETELEKYKEGNSRRAV